MEAATDLIVDENLGPSGIVKPCLVGAFEGGVEAPRSPLLKKLWLCAIGTAAAFALDADVGWLSLLVADLEVVVANLGVFGTVNALVLVEVVTADLGESSRIIRPKNTALLVAADKLSGLWCAIVDDVGAAKRGEPDFEVL